jgi:hypothetical protein
VPMGKRVEWAAEDLKLPSMLLEGSFWVLASVQIATGMSVSDDQDSWLVSHISGIPLCSFWSLHTGSEQSSQRYGQTHDQAPPHKDSSSPLVSRQKTPCNPPFLPSHPISPPTLRYPISILTPSRIFPRNSTSASRFALTAPQGVRRRGHALCSTDNDLHRADARRAAVETQSSQAAFCHWPGSRGRSTNAMKLPIESGYLIRSAEAALKFWHRGIMVSWVVVGTGYRLLLARVGSRGRCRPRCWVRLIFPA